MQGDLFPEELPRDWPSELLQWYETSFQIAWLRLGLTANSPSEKAVNAPIVFLSDDPDGPATRALRFALKSFAGVRESPLAESSLLLEASALQEAATVLAESAAVVIACEDPALEWWALRQAQALGCPAVLASEPNGSPARYVLSGAQPHYLSAPKRSLRVLLAWLSGALCPETAIHEAAPRPTTSANFSGSGRLPADALAEPLKRGLESKAAARLFTPCERAWVGGHPAARRNLQLALAAMNAKASAGEWARWWRHFETRLLILQKGKGRWHERVRERILEEGRAFTDRFLALLAEGTQMDADAAARALATLAFERSNEQPLLATDDVRAWFQAALPSKLNRRLPEPVVGLRWLCGEMESPKELRAARLDAMDCLALLRRRFGTHLQLPQVNGPARTELGQLLALIDWELGHLDPASQKYLKLQRVRICVLLWMGRGLSAFRIYEAMTRAHGFLFRGLYAISRELVSIGSLRTAARLIQRSEFSYVYRVESRLLFSVGLMLAGEGARALSLSRTRADAPPELQQASKAQAIAALPQAWIACRTFGLPRQQATLEAAAAQQHLQPVLAQIESALQAMKPAEAPNAIAEVLRESITADVDDVVRALTAESNAAEAPPLASAQAG